MWCHMAYYIDKLIVRLKNNKNKNNKGGGGSFKSVGVASNRFQITGEVIIRGLA